MTLVPGIVDDSLVFAEKLTEHAEKGEVFRLEEDATRLTVDIIGKVTLDLHLGTQRGENELITAFREQVTLLPNDGFLDPLKMWWPSGIYKRWRNARIMNRYLGRVLDERFEKQRQDTAADDTKVKGRKRVTIDLALQEYQKLQADEDEKSKPTSGMDESFKKAAITQIRTFIFAGTSLQRQAATLCLIADVSIRTRHHKLHDLLRRVLALQEPSLPVSHQTRARLCSRSHSRNGRHDQNRPVHPEQARVHQRRHPRDAAPLASGFQHTDRLPGLQSPRPQDWRGVAD